MKTLTDVRKTVETGVDPRLEGLHSASTTCYHRGREGEGLRRVPLCSFLWTRRPR